jgi:hypothetical protein
VGESVVKDHRKVRLRIFTIEKMLQLSKIVLYLTVARPPGPSQNRIPRTAVQNPFQIYPKASNAA